MTGDSVVDLTARLNALRDVLHTEIRASHNAASARMDAIDASRDQYLSGLEERHAGIDKSISALQTLQEALHAAMEVQTQLRAEALARETLALKDAVQLQMDQRFTDAAHQVQLIQEEIDRRMLAMKDLMDERHAAQIRSFEQQRDNALDSIRAALDASQQAVNKAEIATEKRFEGVNEFRQQLSDQTRNFMTRDEVNVRIDGQGSLIARNTEQLSALELRLTSRLDTMTGQSSGQEAQRTEQRLSQGAIISLVVGVLIFLGVVISTITLVLHK